MIDLLRNNFLVKFDFMPAFCTEINSIEIDSAYVLQVDFAANPDILEFLHKTRTLQVLPTDRNGKVFGPAVVTASPKTALTRSELLMKFDANEDELLMWSYRVWPMRWGSTPLEPSLNSGITLGGQPVEWVVP